MKVQYNLIKRTNQNYYQRYLLLKKDRYARYSTNLGNGWFWSVLVAFDQIDQQPTKVNQIRPSSMHLTVARTVLPVGPKASSADRQKQLCYWPHMVPGTQALSNHCRQAVATAYLVTLGSLQESRRHVCLPPAPGAD